MVRHMRALTRAQGCRAALALLLALAARARSQSPEAAFPLFDFINHGYDVVKGSPFEAIDDGWKASKVFNYGCPSCYSRGNSVHGFRVPDALTVTPLATCSYIPTKSQIVRNVPDFQKAASQIISRRKLDLQVGEVLDVWPEISLFAGSATASAVSDVTLNGNASLVLTTAECSAYDLSADIFDMLNSFSQAFASAAESLSASSTESDCKHFYDTFGTHVATRMTIGASATRKTTFSSQNFRSMIAGGLKSSAIAAVGVDLFSIAIAGVASASLNVDANAANVFRSSVNYAESVCKPQCPPKLPTDALPEDSSHIWLQQIQSNGVPIRAELVSLEWLLKRAGFDAAAARLLQYKQKYIQSVVSCGSPSVWRSADVPPLTVPRNFLGATYLQGRLFAAGGQQANGVVTDIVETLVPGSDVNAWGITDSLPAPRYKFATATQDPFWFVMGGLSASKTTSSDVYALNGINRTWTTLPNMISSRSDFGAVLSNNILYAIGGRNDSAVCLSDIEFLDISTFPVISNSWKMHKFSIPWSASQCRTSFSVNPGPDNTIIITGGANNELPQSSVLLFSLSDGSIRALPSLRPLHDVRLPGALANHASVSVGKSMFVFGGNLIPQTPPSPCNVSADVNVLNIGGLSTWQWKHTMDLPRAEAAAVTNGSSVWLIGGRMCNRSITASKDATEPSLAPLAECSTTSSVIAFHNVTNEFNAVVKCTLRNPVDSPKASFRGRHYAKKGEAKLSNKTKPAVTLRSETLTVAYPTTKAPNIFNMGRGIDVIISDPDANTADPGLREPVFNLSCASCYSFNRTLGGVYLLPNYVSARLSQQCSYDARVSEIHSTYDMQQHLNYWTKTTEWILFWKFTQSHSFSAAEHYTASSENVVVTSKATCSIYDSEVNLYQLGKEQLSLNFVKGVESLPTTANDDEALFNFVSTFGTHVITGATFGGSATLTSTFSEQNFSSLKSSSGDISNNAKLDFLERFMMSAPDSPPFKPRDAGYSEYKSSISSQEVSYMPVAPPLGSGNNVSSNAWLSSIAEGPAVIGSSSLPIWQLFAPQFFPNATGLSEKAQVLKQYIETRYCNDANCLSPTNTTHSAILGSMPTGRADGPVAIAGADVYIVGGSEASENSIIVDNNYSSFELDISDTKSEWKIISGGPPGDDAWDSGCGVGASGVTTPDGNLYILGICGFHVYNIRQKIWTKLVGPVGDTDNKVIRSKLVVGPQSNDSRIFLYAIGGASVACDAPPCQPGDMGTKKGTDYAQLKALDTVKLATVTGDAVRWGGGDKQPMNAARYAFASIVISGKIWVVGGIDSSSAILDSIEVYDPTIDKWTTLPERIPQPAIPRFGHAVAVSADSTTLYMMGGCAALGCCQLDSVYAFSITKRIWFQSASLYTKAAFFGGVSFQNDVQQNVNNVHLFGGYTTVNCSEATQNSMTLTGNVSVSDQHTLYSIHATPVIKDRAGTRFRRRARAMPRNKESNTVTQHVKAVKAASNQQPIILPGVDSLGYGYNILKGNPLARSSTDPGWSTRPILDLLCPAALANGTLLENTYVVPEGVNANALRGCSYLTKDIIIQNQVDLQHAMDQHISFSAGLFIPELAFGARFSQSEGFAQQNTVTTGGKIVTTVSTATCEAFKIALDDSAQIQYSGEFLAALQSLPDPGPGFIPAYYNFVQTFGTHVPVEITVGATASLSTEFQQYDFDQLKSQGVDIQQGAAASFLFLFGASASQGGKYTSQEHRAFQQRVYHNYTTCRPTCPKPVYGVLNDSSWAEMVVTNRGITHAVPIQTKLISIAELLTRFPVPQKTKINRNAAWLARLLNSSQYFSNYANASNVVRRTANAVQWQMLPNISFEQNTNCAINYGSSSLCSSGEGVAVGLRKSSATIISTANRYVQQMNITDASVHMGSSSVLAGWSSGQSAVQGTAQQTQTKLSCVSRIQIADVVYMFGGANISTTTNQAVSFNLTCADSSNGAFQESCWKALAPIPSALHSTALSVVDGNIYLIGGTSTPPASDVDCMPSVPGPVSKIAYKYNIQADKWQEPPPGSKPGEMPTGGRAGSVAVTGESGLIYVVGGFNWYKKGLAEVLSYNTDTDIFQLIEEASLSLPRYFAGTLTTPIGDLIIGGFKSSVSNTAIPAVGSLTTSVLLFNTTELTFTEVAPLTTAVARPAISALNTIAGIPGSVVAGGITCNADGTYIDSPIVQIALVPK